MQYVDTAVVVPAAVYSPEMFAATRVPPVPSSGPAWGQDELAERREGPLTREIGAACYYYAAVVELARHTLFLEDVRRPDSEGKQDEAE